MDCTNVCTGVECIGILHGTCGMYFVEYLPALKCMSELFILQKNPLNSRLLHHSPGPTENAGMRSEYNTIAKSPSTTELAMDLDHIDANEAIHEYALAQASSLVMPGPVARGAVDNAMNTLPSYGSTDMSLTGSSFFNNPNVKSSPSERNNDDVSALSCPFPISGLDLNITTWVCQMMHRIDWLWKYLGESTLGFYFQQAFEQDARDRDAYYGKMMV